MQLLICLSLCLAAPQDAGKQLREAAEAGKVDIVKLLIVDKVDVDAANDYGRTPLAIAAGRGHVEVVRVLIAAGADLESKDRFYKFTPLSAAVNAKQAAVVKALIAAGAKSAGSALPSAAFSDDIATLKAVLTSKDITPAQLKQALATAKSAKQAANVAILEPLVEKLAKDDAEKEKSEGDKADKPETMPEKPAMKLSAEQMKAFEGSYLDPRGLEVQIKPGDKGIEMTVMSSGQKMSLKPTGKDLFEITRSTGGSSMKATFVRDEDKIVSFKWNAGTAEFDLKRQIPSDEPIAKPEWNDYSFDQPNWPAFRGSMSRGIAVGQNLPSKWDVKTGENIVWKTPVNGLGLSCPVVWGDSIYVSTAVPVDEEKPSGSQLKTGLYGDVGSVEDDREYQFKQQCISLSTGDVLWDRDCNQAKPRVKRHAKSSHANPTPATNGDYVVASFSSEGIYCFDANGEKVWEKDLGFLDSGWFYDRSFQWGFAASPYIFEDTVYLQCDIQDQSFIVALDLKSGDEKWRTRRDDIPTWASPVAYRDPNNALRVVVNGTRQGAAYDGTNGKRLWGLSGMSEIVVPTPQVTPNYVLLASGYAPIRPIVAVKHNATGQLLVKKPTSKKAKPEEPKKTTDTKSDEVSGDEPVKDETEDKPGDDAVAKVEKKPAVADRPGQFVWRLENGGSYLPTPIVYEGFIYVVSNSGVLSCFDATTGKRASRVRLRGARSCTGSPVIADGVLYITSETGKTFVVPTGPNQKPTSTSEIGEAVLSTPAIAGGRLLIRAENHLFAVGTKAPAAEVEK